MAVAPVTTFYGAVLDNAALLSLASKLERNSQEKALINNLFVMGAASIGNWGFPIWDSNTNTLLATNLGRPATLETVEITFTSATTGVAQVIAPYIGAAHEDEDVTGEKNKFALQALLRKGTVRNKL